MHSTRQTLQIVRALAVAGLIVSLAAGASALPAFPGAEGFGSETPGGRGGVLLFVDNLDDAGPGSLRAAIDASGARIVTFRVSGDIVLESALADSG